MFHLKLFKGIRRGNFPSLPITHAIWQFRCILFQLTAQSIYAIKTSKNDLNSSYNILKS